MVSGSLIHNWVVNGIKEVLGGFQVHGGYTEIGLGMVIVVN